MSEQPSKTTKTQDFPWERDGILDRLRHLWIEDGLSGLAIARELETQTGVPLTRNAVMGKLHRLGIRRNADPITAEAEAPEPTPSIVVEEPQVIETLEPAPVLDLPFQPVQLQQKEPGLPGVALFDARLFQCRYVISSDGAPTRFCGEQVEDPASSWCAAHAAVVFDRRASNERRKEYDQSKHARNAIGRKAA